MLKAMLLAERAESERLRQIIKELQRHRFGRRAESLPAEQLGDQIGIPPGSGRHASRIPPRRKRLGAKAACVRTVVRWRQRLKVL